MEELAQQRPIASTQTAVTESGRSATALQRPSVAVHVGATTHILREMLRGLEAQLDPAKFLRISRSSIVIVDRIRELQPLFKGEHVIVLENGKQLAMTRGLSRFDLADLARRSLRARAHARPGA